MYIYAVEIGGVLSKAFERGLELMTTFSSFETTWQGVGLRVNWSSGRILPSGLLQLKLELVPYIARLLCQPKYGTVISHLELKYVW